MSADPPKVNGVVQAIEFSTSSLSDISEVAAANEAADGVRIYFGLDEDGKPSNVVVATSEGVDLTEGLMKATSGATSSYPVACDSSSSITK